MNVWVGYRPEQFRLICGTPKSFSKTKGVNRTFCGDCGTSIGYLDDGLPNEMYFTVGFFDNPERFKPEAHASWRMRLPWIELDDGLAHFDSYSRQRDAELGNPADRPPSVPRDPK